MNFDEIKKAMDQEDIDLQVPFSVSEIKSSRTSIQKIKKWIVFDMVPVVIISLILIYFIFCGEMFKSARVIFSYTAFIAIMGNLGILAFQIRVFKNLSIRNMTSKKTIEKYIIWVKTYIEFGKFIFTGLGPSIIIPLAIITIGTEKHTEKFINNLLNLNIPAHQIHITIVCILILSICGYFYSGWYYNNSLGKECKKLEKILDQF